MPASTVCTINLSKPLSASYTMSPRTPPFLVSLQYLKLHSALEIDELASYCPPWWLTFVEPVLLSWSFSRSFWMRSSGEPQSFRAGAIDGRLWAMREALMVGRGVVWSGWQVPMSLWTGSGLTPHPSLSLRGLLLLALMTGERSIYLCAYRSVWVLACSATGSVRAQLPPMSLSAQGDCRAQG